MLSDSLHQFLTLTSECRSRNRDSSDQATFFQSSIWSGYITSGYLSYCCLSIISNQSTHSPLTSDINKAFSYTQLPLTGYFLFSDHSLETLEMVLKIPVDQQFLKYSDQPVWHQ